ncbi:unnamed protein product [Anisakis simplex]|uniref:Uncharacterized protein n=1 Tax=Anisakis simplex TaxID=6269 RepID=A0A0M3KIX4_ANISI|nr:unnamed protein product [Anisakis simplex]
MPVKVCPDYCTQKSSTLAGFIMQYFEKWLKKCDRSEMYAKCLTLEIKNEAFEVATAKHTTHLQTIAEIYKLNTEEMKSNALEVVKVNFFRC